MLTAMILLAAAAHCKADPKLAKEATVTCEAARETALIKHGGAGSRFQGSRIADRAMSGASSGSMMTAPARWR